MEELESGPCDEEMWEYFNSQTSDSYLGANKRGIFDSMLCLNDPRASVSMLEGNEGFRAI